jgi:hypothetical protein
MRFSLTHLLALSALLPLRPAAAQVAGYLDAGSGSMRLGSENPYNIFRLAPSIRLATPSLRLAAEGDYAGHTEHGWQTTGSIQAAARRRYGLLELRLGMEGGWSRTRWGRSAGGWLGEGRLQAGTEKRGFALILGSGQSISRDGTQPLTRIQAGGWGRLGRVDFGFWLKRTGLSVPGDQTLGQERGDSLVSGGKDTDTEGRRSLQDHYTDAQVNLGWSHRAVSFEAGAGRRFGKTVRVTSWYLKGLYQVSSRLALVATTGQFPVDVVSGLPSGSFTTLSMRFNLRSDPPALRAPDFAFSRPGRQAFKATPEADGTYLLMLQVPGARTVEVMGDFTDWKAVLLVPDSGEWWRLRMRIPPGMHEMNLRVDGGPWEVPAGLTGVDDGLGGRAGIFTLE